MVQLCSCRAYQELGQADFYSFDQEKVPFLLIYLLPSLKKCNHKKNGAEKTYLPQSRLLPFVTECTPIGL